MKFDSDEILIKKVLDTIQTPKYDIVSNVQRQIKSRRHRRKIASIAIACVCMMISFGAMAAKIPSVNERLANISPELALLFQPIEVISEDNGIEMEVVGAMNDDEMAIIYVTMKDLVGDRIDETLDIYNYGLTGTYVSNCKIVHYDEVNKIATLRMQANGGEKLNGKKVTFQVDSFLSDKLTFDGVETGIDLSNINEVNDSETILLDTNNNVSGGSGELFEKDIIRVLSPDKRKITLPNIDFMYISNIGYIDGRLHILTKWVGDGVDDHGYFYFTDISGNRIEKYPSNISFGIDESGNTKWGREYQEYIFDVSDIDIDELKLMGFFVSHNNYIEGNWKTTFKIQSVGEEKEVKSNIKLDNLDINNVRVSSLGVTLVGTGENSSLNEIPISINMTDGRTQIFESGMSYNNDNEIKIKYISDIPLNVSEIESVTIDKVIVDFN